MGIIVRIILHNPQKINFFGKTVQDWITGGKISAKLEYLQKYIREGKAIIYCDSYGFSLQIGFLRRSLVVSKMINFIEIYLWLLINKINPFNVDILFDSNKIRHNDILFSITHIYLDNKGEISKTLIDLPCIKTFYLSHYMFSTSIVAKNVERGESVILIAENNLRKNSFYFKKYFPNYSKDVYVLPFSYHERLKKVNPFSRRKNKCLSTGSFQTINIHESTFQEMYEFFKEDTFHPMRKAIYFNRNKITDYIDSFISNIDEDTRQALSKIKKPSGNSLNKIYIKIRNYYVGNFSGNYTRRAYYDFDIVKKYNEYKMVVVPEEIVDLPGIGFVEGMACGCAYIGIKSDMYRDIGLFDGIHYIGYENSLDSLLDVIKYYQIHNDELERIAENGHTFVVEHFNRELVAKKFLDDLEAFYKENSENNFKTNDAILQSSFVLK